MQDYREGSKLNGIEKLKNPLNLNAKLRRKKQWILGFLLNFSHIIKQQCFESARKKNCGKIYSINDVNVMGRNRFSDIYVSYFTTIKKQSCYETLWTQHQKENKAAKIKLFPYTSKKRSENQQESRIL